MIRAAVVGVGAIGQHHARVYNELDGVQLVAVADPDEACRQKAARRFKVPTYPSHVELFAAEHLDVVSVAVPTVLHHRVALCGLEHGVNLHLHLAIAGVSTALPSSRNLQVSLPAKKPALPAMS